MTDLINAKTKLLSGGFTCVVQKQNQVVTSQLRGVRPLVTWYAAGQDLSGYSAADKVIGKATAFLYVLLGVRAIYAGVISQSALTVLKAYGMEVEYGRLVENIINRQGDGICPFELAVLEISDPQAAYKAIRAKMAELNMEL